MVQDTVVAIRKGGDKLTIGHLDPKKYSTQTFSTDPTQASALAWLELRNMLHLKLL